MRILKPTVGGHDGSSFRELLDMWNERKYCEVIPNKNIGYYNLPNETMYPEARPWINAVGDIMLYDNPIADKLSPYLSWKMSLWSNEVHKGPNCYAWTFWPKHPRIFEQVLQEGELGYSERHTQSIFIGTYTTPLRGGDWSKSIQKYWMGSHSAKLLDHPQYLRALKHSKFGLCLPGVGPKCLRDIELIGLGTVPIFTPGVSTDYYVKPERNVHYLYAETPEQVKDVIASCTEAKWNEMHRACQEWYEANCSPLGAFKLTQKIIEDNPR